MAVNGLLSAGALLFEFTFYAPAGLSGTHDSIRLGAAAPAQMRKEGRNVAVLPQERVLFANRMYNWIYAQGQGLADVTLPWAPLAETLDSDTVARLVTEEEERLQHAKKKDLFWTMIGMRS